MYSLFCGWCTTHTNTWHLGIPVIKVPACLCLIQYYPNFLDHRAPLFLWHSVTAKHTLGSCLVVTLIPPPTPPIRPSLVTVQVLFILCLKQLLDPSFCVILTGSTIIAQALVTSQLKISLTAVPPPSSPSCCSGSHMFLEGRAHTLSTYTSTP